MSPELQKEIEDYLRRSERNLAETTREAERISRSFRETQRRLNRHRENLRRLGLLRD